MVFLVGALSVSAGCGAASRTMFVNVPVVDVRAQPHTVVQAHAHDPLEETQLLYGERVAVLNTATGWAQIEAVEQPEFTHQRRWQGYPGWVPASALVAQRVWHEPTIVVAEKWAQVFQDAALRTPAPHDVPLGSRLYARTETATAWRVERFDGSTVWLLRTAARSLKALRALPVAEKRRVILEAATWILGDSYVWGGRSPELKQQATSHRRQGVPVTGVDCSGLVNVAYRVAGIDIPRDAHEQFVRAHPTRILQPADLIFLSKRGDPSSIVHVMLYAGDDEIIEGPGTGTVVRRLALTQRLGHTADSLTPGTVVDGQTVSCGSYLNQ